MEIIKRNTAIICLSPNSGGMEIDSIKLAKKLSEFMNITIIAQKDCFIESQKEDYVDFNNIKLETISFSSNLSLSIIFKTREIIKKYNIKNVIFFGASELKSLYFSFLGLDINLIVRHGTTKSSPKKDFIHKIIYSKVNYHVSISNHLLNNVRYIIPFGKNTQEKLIYPSFYFKEKKEVDITKNNKLSLIHVGRIAEGKGHIDAIKACEILIQNKIDFEFNILGGFEDKYKNEFLDFYNNCKYKDKINLIGFTKDVQSYLFKADIFLFPSYGEGFGNSFIEAISNNLLCLVYKNTTFIEFHNLGFIFNSVENKNIKELSNNLLFLSLNITNEKMKCENNFKLSKKIFSEENEKTNYFLILE